jgi:hypothetical protein
LSGHREGRRDGDLGGTARCAGATTGGLCGYDTCRNGMLVSGGCTSGDAVWLEIPLGLYLSVL